MSYTFSAVDAQAAVEAVFRHLADHRQEFVFLEDVLVGVEHLVVDGHLDHAGLVVQRDDQDFPRWVIWCECR